MLVARCDSTAPKTTSEARPEVRDALGIGTERTRADYGIPRSQREVENGCEIDRAACAPQIEGNLFAGAGGKLEVGGGSERHHRRHRLDVPAQPHDASALLIDSDHRRRIGRETV